MSGSLVDDVTILDSDPLWRRIPPHHFVRDDNRGGGYRPSSAAFDDHPDGTPMSVVLGREVLAAGRLPESVVTGHSGFGLVTFDAQIARSVNQGIMRKPVPGEPAHAEVFGKKTKAVKTKLSRNSTWIIPPPNSGGG